MFLLCMITLEGFHIFLSTTYLDVPVLLIILQQSVLHAIMMTLSNRNMFRVTGPFCGEFTGLFPSHRIGQWRGDSIYSLICAWTNGSVNNRDTGNLRWHRAHYDVRFMISCIMYPISFAKLFGHFWNVQYHQSLISEGDRGGNAGITDDRTGGYLNDCHQLRRRKMYVKSQSQ